LLLVLGFSACLRCFIWVAIVALVGGLVALDYCLFVKAGIATGRTGSRLLENFPIGGSPLYAAPPAPMLRHMPDMKRAAIDNLRAEEDPFRRTAYRIFAFLLAVGIALLLCVVVHLKRRIRVVVALAREAATVLREMPSLLLFPFLGVGSVACFAGCLAHATVCIMTLRPKAIARFGEKYAFIDVSDLQEDPEKAQWYLIYLLTFSALWAWFFHTGLFLTTISGAVSQWYFYRADPDDEDRAGVGIRSPGWWFGRPVALALGRALRYHVGSLALGSFILAAVKLPRLALEYAEGQLGVSGGNSAGRAVAQASRCCLCCIDRCLMFLTNYAFINVAITGKSFCPAAHAAMELVAKYPVQLALDAFASSVVYWVAVLVVPTTNVVITYALIPTAWGACGSFVAVCSFLVAHVAVSVYDVCMTTLFICAVRDAEYFGGRYAPPSLREAMEMPSVDAAPGKVELQRWPGSGEALREPTHEFET